MKDFLTRARTLLTALPTWLTVAAAVLTIVVETLADHVDNPVAAWIVRAALGALVVVGIAAQIVRRVTPVIAIDRGLLPVRAPIPVSKVRDSGESIVALVVIVVVIVFAIFGAAAVFGFHTP